LLNVVFVFRIIGHTLGTTVVRHQMVFGRERPA
jgi:hypothetical protein